MRILFIITFILNSICVNGQDESYNNALNNINVENIKRHLQFLGSDLFEGRGTGRTGGDLSAKYIALELDKIKIKPMGESGTYYQYIQMHSSEPLETSELILSHSDKKSSLKLSKDYLLLAPGEQSFIPIPIPLIFVGYGIVAPEYDHNDYLSIDVSNKIVVYLEGEPLSDLPNYFEGIESTIYSLPETKHRTAISRGARGTIMIPRLENMNEWNEIVKDFEFDYITLAYNPASTLSILINPSLIGDLFDGTQYADISADSIYQIKNLNPAILNISLSFKGEFKQRDFIAPNIVGMIEGINKDENLIITAHYDHLGIGPIVKNDSIYNGVSDNAIGVASLIEIAKSLTNIENKPERSIIILFVTGEEKGLLGSRFYIDHPVVPLYKTLANLNIDGIASFDKFKSLIGVGIEYSNLEDIFMETALNFDMAITKIPKEFQQYESFAQSDHWAFAQAGIPAMLIMDGPDYENYTYEEALGLFKYYSDNIYHTPFDDLNQKINYDAVKMHCQVLLDFIYRLAYKDLLPKWKDGAPFINAQLRNKAERK